MTLDVADWRIAPWTAPAVTSDLPVECGCTWIYRYGRFELKFKYALCMVHRHVAQTVFENKRVPMAMEHGRPAHYRIAPWKPPTQSTRVNHAGYGIAHARHAETILRGDAKKTQKRKRKRNNRV